MQTTNNLLLHSSQALEAAISKRVNGTDLPSSYVPLALFSWFMKFFFACKIQITLMIDHSNAYVSIKNRNISPFFKSCHILNSHALIN